MSDRFDRLNAAFRDALLAWFHAGRRELPWRENRDPYRIWISEIMLQQTRVEAVRGYYERFLKAFPTVEALADCDEEKLLKLWEGLGYYSRARNLRKAARQVVSEYKGAFPQDAASLRKLPGIGEYTAGAIASIAFGSMEPAVDGNVLRVVARICGMTADVTEIPVRRAVADALRRIYPIGSCGDFTESLMELGALVCVPNGVPKCGQCPVGANCIACAEGRTAELPVKKAKAPKKVEHRTLLIVVCHGKVLLHQRPAKGLLAGLWEIPSVDGQLEGGQVKILVQNRVGAVIKLTELRKAKHVFTHKIWEMTAWQIQVEEEFALSAQEVWATRKEIEEKYALPSAFGAYRDAMN